VLRLLEPRLRRSAVIVADDLDMLDALRPYLDDVRADDSGYVSMEIPIGDKLEVSVWHGRDDHGG